MSSQAEHLALTLKGKTLEVMAMPTDGEAASARYHSELAMQAAKRMRSSRHKQKTGQEVCHHLRMMLTCEPAPRSPVTEARPQYELGF